MSRREPAKIDLCSIENATCRANHYYLAALERAEKMRDDADQKSRHEASECVVCYVPYGAGRMGGATSTSRPCAICATILNFGNTCIDMLCVDCARENQLCKHCGGDVDLKYRRKPRAWQSALTAQEAEEAYRNAPDVPLSEQRIQEIVDYATGRKSP